MVFNVDCFFPKHLCDDEANVHTHTSYVWRLPLPGMAVSRLLLQLSSSSVRVCENLLRPSVSSLSLGRVPFLACLECVWLGGYR